MQCDLLHSYTSFVHPLFCWNTRRPLQSYWRREGQTHGSTASVTSLTLCLITHTAGLGLSRPRNSPFAKAGTEILRRKVAFTMRANRSGIYATFSLDAVGLLGDTRYHRLQGRTDMLADVRGSYSLRLRLRCFRTTSLLCDRRLTRSK